MNSIIRYMPNGRSNLSWKCQLFDINAVYNHYVIWRNTNISYTFSEVRPELHYFLLCIFKHNLQRSKRTFSLNIMKEKNLHLEYFQNKTNRILDLVHVMVLIGRNKLINTFGNIRWTAYCIAFIRRLVHYYRVNIKR